MHNYLGLYIQSIYNVTRPLPEKMIIMVFCNYRHRQTLRDGTKHLFTVSVESSQKKIHEYFSLVCRFYPIFHYPFFHYLLPLLKACLQPGGAHTTSWFYVSFLQLFHRQMQVFLRTYFSSTSTFKVKDLPDKEKKKKKQQIKQTKIILLLALNNFQFHCIIFFLLLCLQNIFLFSLHFPMTISSGRMHRESKI